MTYEEINDEYFGKLSWVEKTEYESSNLFGVKYFQPLDLFVEIRINTNNKLVTQEQKQLFSEIEKKYLGLIDEINLFIKNEILKIEQKNNYRIGKINIEENLNLILITITEKFERNVEWSLEYELKNNFAFCTVEFNEWKPFFLGISC